MSNQTNKRKQLSIEQIVDGILLHKDRSILARAITLVESRNENDQQRAAEVVDKIQKSPPKARRIGITGVPGVGKSTLIEALGMHLVEKGEKIAVIAIDPTSSISKGSIMGDKTRMSRLAFHPNAFVRPSPSGSSMTGVQSRTFETIQLCEAFGFDTVLVETVGVGQSQYQVSAMVDLFVLLLLPSSGDELQGIKRGIMEHADLIIVNKADLAGPAASIAAKDCKTALHYLGQKPHGFPTEVLKASSLKAEDIATVWGQVEQFFCHIEASGYLGQLRTKQHVERFRYLADQAVRECTFNQKTIADVFSKTEKEVANHELSALHGSLVVKDRWMADALKKP